MENSKVKIKFDTIEEAIQDIQNGRMVIVVDDADRENEGDLVIAAEKITPETVNFMITYAKGLVCVPLAGQRLDELELRQMVENNQESMRTAFTVSVDAHSRFGITTGISPRTGQRRSRSLSIRAPKKTIWLLPDTFFH